MFLLVGIAIAYQFENAKYRYKEEFGRYAPNCILVMLVSLAVYFFFINHTSVCGLTGFSRFIINLLLFDSFGTALIQF